MNLGTILTTLEVNHSRLEQNNLIYSYYYYLL